jgi:hypothetical protein
VAVADPAEELVCRAPADAEVFARELDAAVEESRPAAVRPPVDSRPLDVTAM